MAGDEELNWFAVLVSFVQKKSIFNLQAEDKDKKNKKNNRTFVFGSWAPLAVLNRMNASGEDNIHTAATKAVNAVPSYISSFKGQRYQSYLGEDRNKKFDIICIIGPIRDKKLTEQVIHEWERTSRGQHPRTITGYHLALKYELEFSINLPLFYQLNPNDVEFVVKSHSMKDGISMTVKPLVASPVMAEPPIVTKPTRKRYPPKSTASLEKSRGRGGRGKVAATAAATKKVRRA
jgi:hypothetical protein